MQDGHETWTDDDAIIEATRADAKTRVRVSRPAAPVVVLGRGSVAARELHLDACVADGIPVLRRRGGGCAVLLDPGNVIVSVAARSPGLGNIQRSFDRITGWLASGLERAGVPGVSVRGVSDLALGDIKIGGSTIHRSRDLVTFSSTILVAPRVDLMQRYLAHPPREPGYRAGRDHGAFVGAVTLLAGPVDPGELQRRLREILDASTVPAL